MRKEVRYLADPPPPPPKSLPGTAAHGNGSRRPSLSGARPLSGTQVLLPSATMARPSSSSSSSASASASAAAASFFGAPSRLPDMLRDIDHQRDAIRMLEQQLEMLALQNGGGQQQRAPSRGGMGGGGAESAFSFGAVAPIAEED